jgi:hypothetical protein
MCRFLPSGTLRRGSVEQPIEGEVPAALNLGELSTLTSASVNLCCQVHNIDSFSFPPFVSRCPWARLNVSHFRKITDGLPADVAPLGNVWLDADPLPHSVAPRLIHPPNASRSSDETNPIPARGALCSI